MNYVWNLDGVKIGSITMNRWESTQLWTSGFAFLADGRVIQWEASVVQYGWYIVITAATGKLGEFQGSTFNLPLEVAAAIRRLI